MKYTQCLQFQGFRMFYIFFSRFHAFTNVTLILFSHFRLNLVPNFESFFPQFSTFKGNFHADIQGYLLILKTSGGWDWNYWKIVFFLYFVSFWVSFGCSKSTKKEKTNLFRTNLRNKQFFYRKALHLELIKQSCTWKKSVANCWCLWTKYISKIFALSIYQKKDQK